MDFAIDFNMIWISRIGGLNPHVTVRINDLIQFLLKTGNPKWCSTNEISN